MSPLAPSPSRAPLVPSSPLAVRKSRRTVKPKIPFDESEPLYRPPVRESPSRASSSPSDLSSAPPSPDSDTSDWHRVPRVVHTRTTALPETPPDSDDSARRAPAPPADGALAKRPRGRPRKYPRLDPDQVKLRIPAATMMYIPPAEPPGVRLPPLASPPDPLQLVAGVAFTLTPAELDAIAAPEHRRRGRPLTRPLHALGQPQRWRRLRPPPDEEAAVRALL